MSRAARQTVTEKDCWYFLHSKSIQTKKNYALNDPENGKELLSIISYNVQAFECELAGIFISNFHYNMIVKFKKFQVLPKKVLIKKAIALHGDNQEKFDIWSKKDWADFNKKLFDVSEFMWTVQMSFSKWFNAKWNIKGEKFWSGRFKSTIVTNDDSALDAILYLDAGALRENVDSELSKYKFSSYYLRSKGEKWIMPIQKLINSSDYQQMLRHRVNLSVKNNPVIKKEIANGYQAGCYLKRQGYFLDGLIIGSAKDVQGWINKLKRKGLHTHKSKPHKIDVGNQYSFRVQSHHFQDYK